MKNKSFIFFNTIICILTFLLPAFTGTLTICAIRHIQSEQSNVINVGEATDTSGFKFVEGEGFLLKVGPTAYLSSLHNKNDKQLSNFKYTWEQGYGITAGALLKGKKLRPSIDLVWERFKVGYSGNFTNRWCYDPPDMDSCYYEEVMFSGHNQVDRYGLNMGVSTIYNFGKNNIYFNCALLLRRTSWFETKFKDNSFSTDILDSGIRYYYKDTNFQFEKHYHLFRRHQLGFKCEAALIRKVGHLHCKLGTSASLYFTDFENKLYDDGNFTFPIGYQLSTMPRTAKTHLLMIGVSIEFILSNTL